MDCWALLQEVSFLIFTISLIFVLYLYRNIQSHVHTHILHFFSPSRRQSTFVYKTHMGGFMYYKVAEWKQWSQKMVSCMIKLWGYSQVLRPLIADNFGMSTTGKSSLPFFKWNLTGWTTTKKTQNKQTNKKPEFEK